MADEPRKIPSTCSNCGGPSYKLAVKLNRFGKHDGADGGKQEPREAIVGGRLCDRCSDNEIWLEAEAEHLAKVARNLEGAELPRTLHRIPFEGFTQPEAVEVAERWGRGEIDGLLLFGDTGVGKTYLAAAAMWLMVQRRRVRWVDTAQVVSSLRAGFNDESRAAAMRVINGNGPAIFDELDKVTPTEFVREALFAALNARVAQGSPILVTTNLTMKELEGKLGKPIVSRLDGYCQLVEMIGPDRRVYKPPTLVAA